MRCLILLLAIIFAELHAQDSWKNVYTKSAWEDRDTWQRANELIAKMGIRGGSKVADIGCHEGYITFKLSKAVGRTGEVFAVDVDQSKLNKLKGYLDEVKINNVTIVKGDYDDPKLPFNFIDAVIIIDTYHEMDDHDDILKHILQSLKRGGRLVICEPIAKQRRGLSRSEQERKHEIDMSYVLADLTKAGFKILSQEDPFVNRKKIKGDEMWVVVASKSLEKE
jgi:ubiquinone/menaquinone biosynthesis C-methylase UbiE